VENLDLGRGEEVQAGSDHLYVLFIQGQGKEEGGELTRLSRQLSIRGHFSPLAM
jgi:hypothetical protein